MQDALYDQGRRVRLPRGGRGIDVLGVDTDLTTPGAHPLYANVHTPRGGGYVAGRGTAVGAALIDLQRIALRYRHARLCGVAGCGSMQALEAAWAAAVAPAQPVPQVPPADDDDHDDRDDFTHAGEIGVAEG